MGDRKKYITSLSYEFDFDEKLLPTTTRPAQIKKEFLDLCKEKSRHYWIKSLLEKAHLLGVAQPFMLINQQNTSEEFLGLLLLIISL